MTMAVRHRSIAAALLGVGLMVVLAWSRFGGGGRWDIESAHPPWETGRTSIYEHIRSHVESGKPGLSAGGETLPDQEIIAKGAKFGWMAGALDGAFGHHGSGGGEKLAAEKTFQAIRAVLKTPDPQSLTILHGALKTGALGQIDPLLELLNSGNVDENRLHRLATWLAIRAPDREPIKIAIAMLGFFRDDASRDVVLVLGRHEEFTLYSAVALTNSLTEPEAHLWELGKHVDGWGRIHVVERLADTEDPGIRRWLLREGYRNTIMYEYTAAICARSGGLLAAIQEPEPDEEILHAAGDLLSTLIQGQGGPAEGIDDYADGAEATELYVRHMVTRAASPDDFLALHAIHRFVRGHDEDWTERGQRGWTAARRGIVEDLSSEIISRETWKQVALAGLMAEDKSAFALAVQVASALGIDTWEKYFERLERGEPHYWYQVMATEDPARVDRVLALAAKQLPVNEIATGPGEELGLGAKWATHQALDFVLQGLCKFPGKGWMFIQAGIQSPVIRNRHMSLRALSAWERATWPTEAEALLREAQEQEPDDQVRERIKKILAGEKLEDT